MRSYFKKLVQNFELERIGGAHKGYQLTPLDRLILEFDLFSLEFLRTQLEAGFLHPELHIYIKNSQDRILYHEN